MGFWADLKADKVRCSKCKDLLYESISPRRDIIFQFSKEWDGWLQVYGVLCKCGKRTTIGWAGIYSINEIPFGSPIEYQLAQALEQEKKFDFDFQYPIYSLEKLVTVVDFFVYPVLAIYAGGYTFHSSKDQIQRDRWQDRTLQRMGIKVLRFTEAEITHNLKRVIKEINNFVKASKN